ncbi:hypothetical protein [Nonomuraea turcica]|uniref:hypothetical protein n=1 Tax=Nonomuraea sp. G32 TaxID=3067274 RepID=UPI00273B98AC|nr:hypothetical protein [Nonomuraea sp. G32]MDP4504181.1 hypothetical protein [Nonomuraea sp. G32]
MGRASRIVLQHDLARGAVQRVSRWEYLTGIIDAEREQIRAARLARGEPYDYDLAAELRPSTPTTPLTTSPRTSRTQAEAAEQVTAAAEAAAGQARAELDREREQNAGELTDCWRTWPPPNNSCAGSSPPPKLRRRPPHSRPRPPKPGPPADLLQTLRDQRT